MDEGAGCSNREQLGIVLQYVKDSIAVETLIECKMLSTIIKKTYNCKINN